MNNARFSHGVWWYEEAARMEEWQMQVFLFRSMFGVTLSSRDEMNFYLATGRVPNGVERRMLELGITSNTIETMRGNDLYAIDGVSELWQKFKPNTNRQTNRTETQSSTSGMTIDVISFRRLHTKLSVTNVTPDTTKTNGYGIIPCTNTLSLYALAESNLCKR